MVDFFTSDLIELNEKALDARALKHKLITSNVANKDVRGYQRLDLTFENQLKEIVENQKNKRNHIYCHNQDQEIYFALYNHSF